MNGDRDALLERLKKLHAHATSAAEIGNAAEAAAFAAKVQELLARHKLTMSEVELAAQDDVDPMDAAIVDAELSQLNPTVGLHRQQRRRALWVEALAAAVARAYSCDVILAKPKGRAVGYVFVGRRSDVAIATYVFHRLAQTGYRLAPRELARASALGLPTKGFVTAFYQGYAMTIGRRLREARAQLERDVRAEGNGVALVRLDRALDEAQQHARKLGGVETLPEKKKTKAESARNLFGHARGVHHGRQADLTGRAVSPPDDVKRLR